MQKETHGVWEELQGTAEIKRKEKTAPSAGDIEKMLMTERIKVLEGEVIKLKEKDAQERIGRLEEVINKIMKEKEEEKEKWKEERKVWMNRIIKCEKVIEEMMQKMSEEKKRAKMKGGKRGSNVDGGRKRKEIEKKVKREEQGRKGRMRSTKRNIRKARTRKTTKKEEQEVGRENKLGVKIKAQEKKGKRAKKERGRAE